MQNFGRKLAEKIGIVAQAGSHVSVGEIRIEHSLSRQDYRNRQALLAKVRNFWVKGVLEKSLHQQILSLGLQNRPNAVESPWNLMVGTKEQPPQDLPPDTTVISIFDEIGAGRTLLILGEPGSGKTITLLQLARDLIVRAEQDVEQRIPVVFNLSSWSSTVLRKGKRASALQTIAEWLIEELSSKYQVPRKIGEAWVKRQQLLLLLDGLDEVRADDRDDCIAAINDFQQEFGTEIVVCCRIRDYEILKNRLNFQSAVFLRSLSSEQVQDYLNRLTADLTGLKSLLVEDISLQELAQSPLMLNIMVLAYEGMPVKQLPQASSIKERQKQLFDIYIKRMLERSRVFSYTAGQDPKSIPRPQYTQQQILCWLAWLAQQMVKESKTVFLIEQVQPSWLSSRKQIVLHRFLNALFFGIISSIVVALISLIHILTVGIIGKLITISAFHELIETLIQMFYGLVFGLVYGLIFGRKDQIEPVEKLKWSWAKAKKSFYNGLLFGFSISIILVIFIGLNSLNSEFWVWLLTFLILLLFCGLFFGLFLGLAFGLIGGFRGLEIQKSYIPNQGIWQSIKNASVSGLAITTIFGLTFVPIFSLISNPLIGLSDGLGMGVSIGVICGLAYGGWACLQHFTLRLILHHQNSVPWNYAKFLDYATERLFLQKVGGGYIFVHRLLMEHFAQLERHN